MLKDKVGLCMREVIGMKEPLTQPFPSGIVQGQFQGILTKVSIASVVTSKFIVDFGIWSVL